MNSQQNGGFVDPQFEYKRNQLEKAYKQMTSIQKSIDNIISSHETLEKVNKNNVTAYKYLHTPGHMQFQDGITVGQAHEKTLNVHQDCLNQLKTLRLNFIKWLNEYSSMQNKLKLRDQFKAKYDKAEADLQALFNQKDMMANVSTDLQLRINRAEKDVDFLRSNFMAQNQKCYEVLKELVTDKHKMMNPILTKYLQINHIFYSKALNHFECIGAIDPAKLFIHRSIYGHEQVTKPKATVSAEMAAAEIADKQNPVHDPHLERMKKIDGADPNAYLTNMDAYREDFIENPIQVHNDPVKADSEVQPQAKSPNKYGKFDKIISGIQASDADQPVNPGNFDEDDSRISAAEAQNQIQLEQEMAKWKEEQNKQNPQNPQSMVGADGGANYYQQQQQQPSAQDQQYYDNYGGQGGYDNYNYDGQYGYDQQQYNDQGYDYNQGAGYDYYNQNYDQQQQQDYENKASTEEQKQDYKDKFKSFYQGYNEDADALTKQISKTQEDGGFGGDYLGGADFSYQKEQQQPPSQPVVPQQEQPAANKQFGGFNFDFLDGGAGGGSQQAAQPSSGAPGGNPFGGAQQQQKPSLAPNFSKDNFTTSHPEKYDVLGDILGGGAPSGQQQPPQGYNTQPQQQPKNDDPFSFLMDPNVKPLAAAAASGAGAAFANSFNPQATGTLSNQFNNMNLGGAQSNPFSQPAFAGFDPSSGSQAQPPQQQQQPPAKKDEFADLLNF